MDVKSVNWVKTWLVSGRAVVAGLILATAGLASAQVTPSSTGSTLDPTQTQGALLYDSSQSATPSSTNQNGLGGSQSGNGTNSNPYSQNSLSSPLNVNSPNGNSSLLPLQQLLSQNGMNSETTQNVLKKPPTPGEFQKYMYSLLGYRLEVFGTKLVLPALRDFATPATATVPPSYVVQPGDTIEVALSGSLDGTVNANVDTNGAIFITGVGAVHVAGVRNADLHDVISRAIGEKFRDFQASVSITKLRGIRVYVTGFANNPGAFTVSSLSTLADAVFQAGGPNSGGSWRSIQLYRDGHEISDFDLYQLMRGGSRVDDTLLQNGDVLFIPPAGPQVAVIGSVSDEAIYEAKPGESVAGILAAAGGPNTVGDHTRFIIYHSDAPNEAGPQQFPMSAAASMAVRAGDIIQILSIGTLQMPTENEKIVVRVEGEVRHPGIYYVAPGTRTGDIIAQAGGLTARAFPYGAKFTRQTVQMQQQDSYKEALNQLEISLSASPLLQDPTLATGDRTSQMAAARAVLTRLREAKPDGRVVLDISPDARSLPGDIALENNDALEIPPRPSSVGVFGAVYHPSSFLLDSGHRALRVRDYIDEAGGPLPAADKGGIFVIHANGSVVPRKRGALNDRVLPGDVVFVPVRSSPNLFWSHLSAISTTLFTFGLGAASLAATLVAVGL